MNRDKAINYHSEGAKKVFAFMNGVFLTVNQKINYVTKDDNVNTRRLQKAAEKRLEFYQ